MIQYIDNESIFDTNYEVIVNSVNCVGVMGKGIAKEFKTRWPEMFESYRKMCSNGLLWPGRFHWYNIGNLFTEGPQWILNFPSKIDWRKPAKYEYIELGFESICRDVRSGKTYGMKSFAFPLLGCGVGGLNPEKVKELFDKHFAAIDYIDIKVYTHLYKS